MEPDDLEFDLTDDLPSTFAWGLPDEQAVTPKASGHAPAPWITVPEAAVILGIGEKAVRAAVERGEIAHRWIGRRLLISAKELLLPCPVRTRRRSRK